MTGLLPGGVPQREPYPSEDAFFKKNTHISGLAADDDSVVLNPYSNLSPTERHCVALNEAARVVMRRDPELQPIFDLTPEQLSSFQSYGSLNSVRATVAARILSGDPSALRPTADQIRFVKKLATAMGLKKRKASLSPS